MVDLPRFWFGSAGSFKTAPSFFLVYSHSVLTRTCLRSVLRPLDTVPIIGCQTRPGYLWTSVSVVFLSVGPRHLLLLLRASSTCWISWLNNDLPLSLLVYVYPWQHDSNNSDGTMFFCLQWEVATSSASQWTSAPQLRKGTLSITLQRVSLIKYAKNRIF